MWHEIANTFYEKKKDWKFIIEHKRKEFPENVLRDSDNLVEMNLQSDCYYRGKPLQVPPPDREADISEIPGMRMADAEKIKAAGYLTVQNIIDVSIEELEEKVKGIGYILAAKYKKACVQSAPNESGASIREFCFYQVPNEIINPATIFQGGIEKQFPNKPVSPMVDTRKYYTPHDCSTDGECHINYIEEINGQKVYKRCTVPEWIAWCGWKEGELTPVGQREDTTPKELDAEAEMRLKELKQKGEERKAKLHR
ncbi:MAG: hypothetical protein ACFFCW_01820 [Candidatus Hodarchaeota archaeon]